MACAGSRPVGSLNWLHVSFAKSPQDFPGLCSFCQWYIIRVTFCALFRKIIRSVHYLGYRGARLRFCKKPRKFSRRFRKIFYRWPILKISIDRIVRGHVGYKDVQKHLWVVHAGFSEKFGLCENRPKWHFLDFGIKKTFFLRWILLWGIG